MLHALIRWFDNSRSEVRSAARSAIGSRSAMPAPVGSPAGGWWREVDWVRVLPFLGLHVACLAVLWVGVSPVALVVCAASYLVRMFAITGFYHRYFSHRSFKTGRVTQLLFAVLGAASAQRGPLWWAAHHRRHHRDADQPADPHRPADGLLWAHVGWFLCDRNFRTDRSRVRDWLRYPELRWLDRFDLLVPLAYAAAMYLGGVWLAARHPELGTSGAQMLVWGFFVSTVLLTHATLLVNSLAHVWGGRRFETHDESRNNGVIALLTLGEGWHNNHHRYAGSARQGFYWWQIDVSYALLRLLALCSLVWDLRPVPQRILQEGRRR
jgi:stearoyl-CoA desaturase (Delta-9 desaturase)